MSQGQVSEAARPLVLILSSHVAAGAVGGGAQVVALAREGIDTVLVPTVLFGRHPGLGAPGGGATPQDIFEGVLKGVADDGVFTRLSAVITGYFATPGQVAVAAQALDRVKAVNPAALIVVDPIMGDFPQGLYVPQPVAEAMAGALISRADLVAPNAWELHYLSGLNLADPVAAARSLGRPVLVSSVDLGDEIGVIYADKNEAWLVAHARAPSAPKGTGDHLTARFTAGRLRGQTPRDALRSAVQAVAAGILGQAAVREARIAP